jgi:predicted metal-dependent enzyme (double-stranded beta helix superfamily)
VSPTSQHEAAAAAQRPGEDEYVVDAPRLRRFVSEVRSALADSTSREDALVRLRPILAELLGEQGWLPEQYAAACPGSGMGGGIGQWLLYRSGESDLSLFSLVVPAGSATPVHDHLAYGLVGLYRGRQLERVYARRDDGQADGQAELALVEERQLAAGEIYDLLPPDGDIHAVETLGQDASVSIHLLANDVGCIWRHAFDPGAGTVRAFRSGYSNRACQEEAASSAS